MLVVAEGWGVGADAHAGIELIDEVDRHRVAALAGVAAGAALVGFPVEHLVRQRAHREGAHVERWVEDNLPTRAEDANRQVGAIQKDARGVLQGLRVRREFTAALRCDVVGEDGVTVVAVAEPVADVL